MYLVFDIGGTKMRFANSFDGKNFQNVEIYQTPQEFEKALVLMQKFIWTADSTHPNNRFCVGLPGVFDKDKTKLVSAPNLPFWIGKPIKQELEKLAKTEVIVANDAALAGLGEAVVGVGEKYRINAYITIGTGVGGARIVDKKIDDSVYGFEPGHQYIDSTGEVDLESLIGGRGLLRKYGKNPEEITDLSTWKDISKNLALGLTNTIVHWSPDALILGGSISQNENISVSKLASEIKSRLRVFPKVPEIIKGALGDKAGLFGGVELLRSKSEG